ncbi:hypothetical protein KLVAMA180M_14425 [Klebsiella variicola subsp. variicola]
MTIEKSRFSSEAAPQPNVNTGVINGNDFAAIVPVIAGRIGGREANIASARALHKALGVGRDFTNWIKGRIDQYGFIAGTDFIRVENLSTPKRASAKTRQQVEHDYLLSLDMAKEVAMVERNEQGRAVRRYFIQCEEALQRSVPEIAAQYRRQLKARISAANNFKPMCEALDAARAEQGKQTQQRHYSNESNMIARIVLGGMTAKQWAQANGITGEPRDSMNAAQLEHLAYESLSGFGYTCKKLTGSAPSAQRQVVLIHRFTTPLGPMFVCATQRGICLLEFVDRRALETEFSDLQRRFDASIIAGENAHTRQAQQEITEYFAGRRQSFEVALDTPGSEFQRAVWRHLQYVSFGETTHYQSIAMDIGKPTATRAVAAANGANRVAIIIPCHRIIGKDGSMTGYGGGVARKKWLINHEATIREKCG